MILARSCRNTEGQSIPRNEFPQSSKGGPAPASNCPVVFATLEGVGGISERPICVFFPWIDQWSSFWLRCILFVYLSLRSYAKRQPHSTTGRLRSGDKQVRRIESGSVASPANYAIACPG